MILNGSRVPRIHWIVNLEFVRSYLSFGADPIMLYLDWIIRLFTSESYYEICVRPYAYSHMKNVAVMYLRHNPKGPCSSAGKVRN